MTKEPRGGCPCLYVEPCDPDCSCRHPAMSRGCERCCSYGSLKQRRLAALYLTAPDTEAGRATVTEAVVAMNREGDSALIKLQAAYIRELQAMLEKRSQMVPATANQT